MTSTSIPNLTSLPLEDLLEVAEQVTGLLVEQLAVPHALEAMAPMQLPSRGGDWGALLEPEEKSGPVQDGEAGADEGNGPSEPGENDISAEPASAGSRPAVEDAVKGHSDAQPGPTLPSVTTRIERVARSVGCLQTALAGHVDRAFGHGADRRELLGIPDGKCAFRETSDYLRQHLRIRRSEARRRLDRARDLSANRTGLTGDVSEPRMPELAVAVEDGAVDPAAVDLVRTTLAEARQHATLSGVASELIDEISSEGERLLTAQARALDPDQLRRVCERWKLWAEAMVNPDGQEPNEALLNVRQGLFYVGYRGGLHRWAITATELQHEVLLTVANAATNPRARQSSGGFNDLLSAAEEGQTTTEEPQATTEAEATGDQHGESEAPTTAEVGEPAARDSEYSKSSGPVEDGARQDTAPDTEDPEPAAAAPTEQPAIPTDPRSTARKQLDGLISSLQGALSMATGNGLPAAGGVRPQVLVTIDYARLLAQVEEHELGSTSEAAFSGLIGPTTIRTIACDAEIIPAVLGGDGEVLDVGRSQRLFSPRLRRAIIARDGGCCAPGCTMPPPWCEVHHVNAWEDGGGTSVDNGVLLCSHHHHAVHTGTWRIDMRVGIPWFIPAPYLDPDRRPQRNRYWRP